MEFPIFPFAPRSSVSVPVEVQRLSSNSPICKIPPHGHLFFELMLITEGSGFIMVDGGVHAALPGCIFVIPPGMPHDARALGTASGWILMFKSEGMDMSAEPRLALFEDTPAGLVFDLPHRFSGTAKASISLPEPEMATVLQLLEQIETELAQRLPGYEIAVRATLNLVMVQVGRTRQVADSGPVDTGPHGRELLARVFKDIDRYFSSDASLVSAAHRLGMTPAHLTTRIRRLTGRTHGNWVIERRMIEARHRLVTTPDSLTEIAVAIGYSDIESFIRRFRAHHGITPTQWRNKAYSKDTAVPPPMPAHKS
jgi:AraC-like DNA-binding protein